MSTKGVLTDEKGKEKHPPEMGGKEEKDNNMGFVILFFFLGLVFSMIIGWVIFPQLLYSEKQQPFDFDHVLHVKELGDCESCHFFREDGTFSGVPKLSQCTDCHEEPMGENPNEITFVEEYVAKNREVPWLVYSKQPDCVFFSHAAHVIKGKMECETCHGDYAESRNLKPYESNRITGVSRDIWGKNIAGIKTHVYDRMKMDDCAECHKEANGEGGSVQTKRDACFVCHK